MLRILLVPSSDYVGHLFTQRHNQIFGPMRRHLIKPVMSKRLLIRRIKTEIAKDDLASFCKNMLEVLFDLRDYSRSPCRNMCCLEPAE